MYITIVTLNRFSLFFSFQNIFLTIYKYMAQEQLDITCSTLVNKKRTMIKIGRIFHQLRVANWCLNYDIRIIVR